MFRLPAVAVLDDSYLRRDVCIAQRILSGYRKQNLTVMDKSETCESKSILVVGVAVTSVLIARTITALADVQAIENHALGLRAALQQPLDGLTEFGKAGDICPCY